ncbi:uncharacterized protein J7T54_007330 [Emericellopsis cladophorae]|uniref:IQ calmodulin-binding motif domain protein n=1 Tax=Emericellopsis cladophorae TaxID=2686198 RepID=A0A9P9XZR0_9HYPO|nr:uncharacterized protein J7T54_007330 [Emericellopsis cladophorae]KAI6780851.1 hypothetical protein J7T54_007330 [Emericellopsis cladophorae]
MRRDSLDVHMDLSPSNEPNTLVVDDDDADLRLMTDTYDLSMPPEHDDEDDDDPILHEDRVFTPPPHIAARFYRPSHARRRESAASSRRNSFSSAHSKCSSSLPTEGDQSKHIAQHLRRASFLEDRKARLADRAAHAEKVRLRAATAKAASKDTKPSEERALAAQQARERNLAEIVANCAEEVKRAKQVATLMKEKRETDQAKMKAQMEERLAEADRRREELRRQNARNRGRGQSVLVRKSSPVNPRRRMSPEEAASKILSWWRCCIRRRAMIDFNSLGLSVDGIRSTSFDTVTELLAEEKVLTTTARLLRTCGLQEADPGSVGEMAAVRTFLSAFLILGHPNQVLATKTDGDNEGDMSSHRLPSADLDNPQLQDLVSKAKDLLIVFENILMRLSSTNRYTVPPALVSKLPEAYAVFHNAFIAWKSRDSNALIEVMLMQFVELDAIFQTVKDTTDDAASQLYQQSIRDSQLMLIVRIKKLAGQEAGKKMIFDAVAEARKARRAKKKTGDTKPRVAEPTPSESDASQRPLTPPATPSNTQAQTQTKAIAIKSPGGLGGLLPDNRGIVHELAINKEYQIPINEYKAQVSDASRSMFEQMRGSMQSDAPIDNAVNFHFFMLMAGEIKDKLQRMLKPGNSMYNLIQEMFDPELAQKQFERGSFSYEKFFSAMAGLLPKLCAPFRDAEVKDLVDNKLGDGNLIDRVEALSGFIDVMLCDYINYMLRVAAPQLIESAPQYEAKRFTQEIESGEIDLSAAEAAWRAARTKVLAEVQRRDPEGINHPKSRPTGTRIYAQILVDVFTQPLPLEEGTVPEMLRLDSQRVSEVSKTVQHVITVGAVLLQCKNLLKRDVRSPWKVEASRIMSVLEANHPNTETIVDGTMAAVEGRSMPAATKQHLRALVSKVITASQDMAIRGTEPREPVLRLLLTRLRGNILARLAPGSASERVKAANTAGERLASLGLSEFVDRVRGVSMLLERIGAVDRGAHGAWWDAIATKLEQEDTS